MKSNKKINKLLLTALCVLMMSCALFTSCGSEKPYVVSIEKTDTQENQDIYTIFYSDGTTNHFTVTNGKDGENAPLTIEDAYNHYVKTYGSISYEEFLRIYVSAKGDEEIAKSISKATTSCVTLYTEFTETTSGGGYLPTTSYVTGLYTGSGVIYKISSDYTYIITNYHVIYNTEAYGSKISQNIHCYLYGSESSPVESGNGAYGKTYDYGSYGIACEYVGGSAVADIALVRAKTSDIKAINDSVSAVTFADKYYLGETAIAIGNAAGNGQNVSKGIVSSANENISLSVDGVVRTYRSIKMDTVIYHGSSGGGLFNVRGEIIGITNAGQGTEEQSMNYAVPLEIAKNVADGIFYYYTDGISTTKNTYKLTFGFTAVETNVRSVYDSSTGRTRDLADNQIESVNNGSLAQKLGLKANDYIKTLTVNGKATVINRGYNVSDVAYSVRPGDKVAIGYTRGGVSAQTTTYTVQQSDLTAVA